MCKAVFDAYKPKTVIDVGCAIGDYVKGFLDLGVDASGLEGAKDCLPYLMIPRERLLLWDLREALPLAKAGIWKADVALCLEVAEHIEEEYSENFFYNLAHLSDQVVMSFCPPGKGGGHYHVNEQESAYWISGMARQGMVYRRGKAEEVREGWAVVASKKAMRSYDQHLLCFKAGG